MLKPKGSKNPEIKRAALKADLDRMWDDLRSGKATPLSKLDVRPWTNRNVPRINHHAGCPVCYSNYHRSLQRAAPAFSGPIAYCPLHVRPEPRDGETTPAR